MMNSVAKFFLVLGVFTIPYYFFESGTLQLSHCFLLVFIFFRFVQKKGLVVSRRLFFLIFPFLLYAFVLNLVYCMIYESLSFLAFPIQLTFDFLVLFVLVNFLQEESDEINKIPLLMFVILLCLLLLWFFGFGGYKNAPRYNGYFNDPNQMAFFVLCAGTVAVLYVRNYFALIIILFFVVVLVLLTQSRSGLLGCSLLLFSTLFLFLNTKSSRSLQNSVFVICFLVIVVVPVLMYGGLSENSYINASIDRFLSSDFAGQAANRGYNRIVDYKEMLFFGAGQGLDLRFNSFVEVHSTWAGVLFYYGFLGLFLFLMVFVYIFRGLDFYQKMLFLVPMAYSFTTFGARTVIFWILIACFYRVSVENRNKKNGVSSV